MRKIKCLRAKLLPAACGADISNGSERALYVPMKHVFKTLKRPHRAVNLMFAYYPFDNGWPKRASQIMKWKPGMKQWDLPFEDYEVYPGGPDGSRDAEVFRQFRDVRIFGQDIHLTLTIDLRVPDEDLKQIARELRAYGRVFFRINHECNGDWFQFNRRNTYKQVSDFFIRFHHILKEEAPLVKTVFCINGFDQQERMHLGEEELAGAVRVADVLAIDRYLSLHFGWPDTFRDDPTVYFDLKLDQWWETMKAHYRQLCEIRGDDSFPFTLPELNADSDVNGFYGQARRISELYDLVRTEGKGWISAVTMYQFRDRGGLGLELEDRDTFQFVKRVPSCAAYRKAVSNPAFLPLIKTAEIINEEQFPLHLKWYSSEEADGISLCGLRPENSVRMILKMKKGNYLIECKGRWFHTESTVDLKTTVLPGESFCLNIFTPPETGENSIGADGSYLPYYQNSISQMPLLLF